MKHLFNIFTIFVISCFLVLPGVAVAQEISVHDVFITAGDLDIKPIESEGVTCESLFMKNGEYNALYYALKDAFTLIKFAAPILVLVLSTMDYIKAITSHDAEGLKKSNAKFVKRLAIGVAIFLLPFLLDFTFEAFGLYDLGTCGVGK